MTLRMVIRQNHKKASKFFLYDNTPSAGCHSLSLHDALPISRALGSLLGDAAAQPVLSFFVDEVSRRDERDRKSTRLNSSHEWISYAVFCLKKKSLQDMEA